MSLPVPYFQQTAQTNSERNRLYRIALDLGSDSIVAYVAKPGESRAIRIDLQFFLKALAKDPDFLMTDGRPSHRLKSRFAKNTSVIATPERRKTQLGDDEVVTEVLPRDHSRLTLVESVGYIADGGRSPRSFQDAEDIGRCFFNFINDRQDCWPFDVLLPNSKIVFQSGLSLGKRSMYGSDVVPPLELMKNQVCLLLENFVRCSEQLWDEDGQSPEWEDCVVILTVPNTYNPFHQRMLKRAVSLQLGCAVEIITESDAVVFYYRDTVKPGQGSYVDGTAERNFITLDVGKGTTDLTLMQLAYREPSAEEKERLGFPTDFDSVYPHFHVLGRTGRASGGAQMTFAIAQFFERMVLRRVQDILGNLASKHPDRRAMLESITALPFRFTTSSPDLLTDANYTEAILALEQIAEWYKHHLDLVDGEIEMPDLRESPKSLNALLPSVKVLAEFSKRALQEHLSTHGLHDLDPFDYTKLFQSLRDEIENVFLMPNRYNQTAIERLEEKPPQKSDSHWRFLAEETRSYVDVNVDQVLVELANAYVGYHRSRPIKTAKEALQSMLPRGQTEATVLGTDFVIAGQGSQFKPLRRRLEEVLKQAGLGSILKERSLLHAGPTTPAPVESEDKLLAKIGRFLSEKGSSGSPQQNYRLAHSRVVELEPENLKDACALGALRWFIANPIMLSSKAIHGQLVCVLAGGENCIYVDMDELNEAGETDLTPDKLGNVADVWEIYYLPAKNMDFESQGPSRASYSKLFDLNTNRIRFVLTDQGLRVIGLQDSLEKRLDSQYGASDQESLRAMLWPAIIF